MVAPKEQNVEKDIKKISLALFQIAEEINILEIPEKKKKYLFKLIKEQDKKILKIHSIKFSEKDKKNLLDFFN